jgi:ribulose-phosphate 3-epimerase
MSVNPGYGGQKFIEHSYEKIKKLKALVEREGSKTIIQVDGGVTLDNVDELVKAGTECVVAGSSIFNAENPSKVIALLREA